MEDSSSAARSISCWTLRRFWRDDPGIFNAFCQLIWDTLHGFVTDSCVPVRRRRLRQCPPHKPAHLKRVRTPHPGLRDDDRVASPGFVGRSNAGLAAPDFTATNAVIEEEPQWRLRSDGKRYRTATMPA